ncbi:twitching motility protein PilT [Desulfacinum hydrothermale DSM 13146]|uniref:Twitching motility protein PilT n=1 Tax=Desulfacinum hydrothermale DSM 13146 TaxID=1121390 RepID=A0A1W1X532_9BACT|nr:type IV pilus twitching motility protein PilT [Desulfacinum hydrothermale]SMC19059.1 twitching motility protein PilT [Desulfacinum hydrothermale DSM 13146]
MISLQDLLARMPELEASDLHITAGARPQYRIYGRLVPARDEILRPADTERLCLGILSQEQKEQFLRDGELDFSFGLEGVSLFRVNLFRQRGSVGGSFRAIPFRVPSLDELGLPPVIADLLQKPRGLVLVTGPTGSGKSTTLAAMIDWINQNRSGHIVTIEDPIEYVHSHKKCLVNQREVGRDTQSFHSALRRVLRQDPDVIMIGEMRDLETIQAALTLSETGHLTLGTLHTNTAVQTIHRIIDVFPQHQQNQVRLQLSMVLEGTVSQLLLPHVDGVGRLLALEIFLPTPAMRHLIRDNKIHQIYAQMQLGQTETQMVTMNQSLLRLVQQGSLSMETALNYSPDPEELRTMVSRQAAF